MKFLKKHFTKFIMSFTLVFTSLFVAFGCNTYAYTIGQDGNLYSDNLCSDTWSYNNTQSYSQYEGIHDYNLNDILQDNYGTYNFSIYFEQSVQNNVAIELRINWGYGYNTATSSNLNGRLNITFDYEDNGNTYQIRVYATYGTATTKSVEFYKSMLVAGNSSPNYEPYGEIWYSEQNFDDLQESYEHMSQQYKNLKDSIYFGCFAFLDTVNIYCYDSNNNATFYDSDLETLISNHYIDNSIFYFSTLVTDYLHKNVNFVKCDILFHFTNMNYSFVNLAFTSDSSFDFGCTLIFGNNINYSRFIGLNNENFLIDSTRISKYAYLYDSYIVSDLNFNNLTDITYPNIIIASNDSYSLGYNDGVQSQSSNIDSLNNDIVDLQNTNYALRQSINELTSAYNDLNTSFNNMLNGNNFANLFFTIAETPFASFKQIWNVDFLGVNLAGFVTGILFLGLVIWVIKKIF